MSPHEYILVLHAGEDTRLLQGYVTKQKHEKKDEIKKGKIFPAR